MPCRERPFTGLLTQIWKGHSATDPEGIHTCPARRLVEAITGLDSTVTIIRADGRSVAGTEMTALMDFGIKKGDTITVTVDGGHEQANSSALAKFFSDIL